MKVLTYFEAIPEVRRPPTQKDEWHRAWAAAGFEPMEAGPTELRKSRWRIGASTVFGMPPSPRSRSLDRACFLRWFAYSALIGPEPLATPVLCVDYDCLPGTFRPEDVVWDEVVIYDEGAVPSAVSFTGRGLSKVHDILLKDGSLRKDAWYCDMLVFQHNRSGFTLTSAKGLAHGR